MRSWHDGNRNRWQAGSARCWLIAAAWIVGAVAMAFAPWARRGPRMFRRRRFCSGSRRRTTRWNGESADMFLAGYGAVYTPPPGRADLSNFSVGYDVYDRFDLGRPAIQRCMARKPGSSSLPTCCTVSMGGCISTPCYNHNAYSENDYVTNNPQFAVLSISAGRRLSRIHVGESRWRHRSGRRAGNVWRFSRPGLRRRLSQRTVVGLARHRPSRAVGRRFQLIRHPVAAGNPQNIPAGVTAWVGSAGECARCGQRAVLSGSRSGRA